MSIERAHWFDVLSSSLARGSHRRGLLRAVSILGAGAAFGDAAIIRGAEKKKSKKKQKSKKKRPASPPPPPTPCSGGACADQWAGNQAEIDYCEFICSQCDGNDARDFCIVDGVLLPGKIAVCCDELAPCCGGECCPVGYNPDLKCCAGVCTDTSDNPSHCGDCGKACGDGQECRFGRCGCPPSCPQGKNCIHNDGSFCVEHPNRPDCHCGCFPGYKYCQHREGHMVCVSDCSLVT